MAGGCRLFASITAGHDGQDAQVCSRPEIKAMSKAMAAWEPVVEDAARKQGRVPVTLRCECIPARAIFASTGTALGPNFTSEVCCKAFRIPPGQRIGEADRA